MAETQGLPGGQLKITPPSGQPLNHLAPLSLVVIRAFIQQTHQLVLCEAWGDGIVLASWSLDWRRRNSKVIILVVKATKKGDRAQH